MAIEFKLPELGENIEGGTITKLLVAEGDTVAKDQPVLEIETDKAVVEVPAPAAGTIESLEVSEGAEIKVGQLLMVIAGDGAAAPAPKKTKAEPAPQSTSQPPAAREPERPRDEPASPAAEPARIAPPPQTQRDRRVTASPAVRRFARLIGIDIYDVPPANGLRITVEDVKAYSRRLNKERSAGAVAGALPTAPPLPDFSKFGQIEREPMSKIRQRTAERLSVAWATIPHVTQHDKADITELEKFRKAQSPKAEAHGGKLTATAILVKVLAVALKRFPQFNSSIDMAKNELIRKHYYHIGIAVDTENGLLVPVLRNADEKSLIEIAAELAALSQKARDRKLTLEDMQGGCITITNLGGIGGTAFTPIVNPPEVAILGVSRAQTEPVWDGKAFVPRTMMPLSLSYDHRVIDGADAVRFTRWVCEALEQPMLLVLGG